HEWVECLSGQEVVETELSATTATLGDVLGRARALIGASAYLSLDDDREVIVGLSCGGCGVSRPALGLAYSLKEDDARCPRCGAPMRPALRWGLDGSEGISDRTLAEIGFPPLHILRARDDGSGREALLELTGDQKTLFGASE